MSRNFYDKNAEAFIENTINADMKVQYEMFEKYLPATGKLLDIGFGSGRDSLYFSKNYKVVSIDNSEAFVEEGKKVLNNQVLLIDARKMNFKEEFDAIWACASLLHLPYKELPNVLNKCLNALKPNGVMYMSFKYGNYEGIRSGRYFTDLNEHKLKNLIADTAFKLNETKITEDVRADRYEKWLNVIIKK